MANQNLKAELSKNKIILVLVSDYEFNEAITEFTFIDAISKTVGISKKKDNCLYVQSPAALTELSIALSKCLEKKSYEYIIVDSLTTLLVYSQTDPVVKFLHSFVGKIRNANSKAVLVALQSDKKSELLSQINMFVDKSIDYGKED